MVAITVRFVTVLGSFFFPLVCNLCAADSKSLWQIGQSDGANLEFALAPKGHKEFRDDGFFVVGQSDASRDWPYVHPGPADGWGGGREHSFAIVFGLKNKP